MQGKHPSLRRCNGLYAIDFLRGLLLAFRFKHLLQKISILPFLFVLKMGQEYGADWGVSVLFLQQPMYTTNMG